MVDVKVNEFLLLHAKAEETWRFDRANLSPMTLIAKPIDLIHIRIRKYLYTQF